jgi:hypothetical protein
MAKLFQVTWPPKYGTTGDLQIQKHWIFKSTFALECVLRCPLQSATALDVANVPLSRSTPNQVRPQTATLSANSLSYW